jgi:hypothetical protein
MIRTIGFTSRWTSNVSSLQIASSAARTTGLSSAAATVWSRPTSSVRSARSSGVRSRPLTIDVSAISGSAAAISALA